MTNYQMTEEPNSVEGARGAFVVVVPLTPYCWKKSSGRSPAEIMNDWEGFMKSLGDMCFYAAFQDFKKILPENARLRVKVDATIEGE